MKLLLITLMFMAIVPAGYSQDLPFRNIPEAPASYTVENVLSRFLDGAGYRYYWATEGLNEDDLDFRPSDEGRSIRETLEHIYSLCLVIRNTFQQEPNIRPETLPKMTIAELRTLTLQAIAEASELSRNKQNYESLAITFTSGDQRADFPFWNLINGPMSDVLYHIGQVVSFRRSAGNPMYEGVNVFTGQTRE